MNAGTMTADKLIKKFADNSNGNLKGMMVWMDAQKDPSDTNKYKYKITIILNEQAYLVEPKDKGYSFEISLIVDVINQILKSSYLHYHIKLLVILNKMNKQ